MSDLLTEAVAAWNSKHGKKSPRKAKKTVGKKAAGKKTSPPKKTAGKKKAAARKAKSNSRSATPQN
jgi:hypothetical protein